MRRDRIGRKRIGPIDLERDIKDQSTFIYSFPGRGAGGPIAVLGAGAWGTALAMAMARGGQAVRLYARDARYAAQMRAERENKRRLPGYSLPTSIAIIDDIDEAVDAAGIVFLAGPSRAAESLAARANVHAGEETPFVLCAKGLAENGDFLSSRVAELRGEAPVLVLSGPSFANEVARGAQTVVAVSGPAATAQAICSHLSTETFVMTPCSDIRTVQIAGVFKNVSAILCGVSDELGAGANTRAALMSEAIREASVFAKACGGRPETLLGPAGFGDFVLTCTDPQSRNYRMGRGLVSGRVDGGEIHEGAANVAALVRRAEKLGVDVPLVAAVAELVSGKIDARQAMSVAFSQRLRYSRGLSVVA